MPPGCNRTRDNPRNAAPPPWEPSELGVTPRRRRRFPPGAPAAGYIRCTARAWARPGSGALVLRLRRLPHFSGPQGRGRQHVRLDSGDRFKRFADCQRVEIGQHLRQTGRVVRRQSAPQLRPALESLAPSSSSQTPHICHLQGMGLCWRRDQAEASAIPGLAWRELTLSKPPFEGTRRRIVRLRSTERATPRDQRACRPYVPRSLEAGALSEERSLNTLVAPKGNKPRALQEGRQCDPASSLCSLRSRTLPSAEGIAAEA